MMALPRIFAGLILLVQICVALTAGPAIHEKRDVFPDTWKKVARASPSWTVPVRIALTPRNIDSGHEWLMDISDPESANFGNHWTADQVFNAFAPDAQSVAAVQEWLSGAGVAKDRQKLASSLGHISFEAKVAEIEFAFRTAYHVWEHESGARALSCDEYSLPVHLKHTVDFVTPGIGLHPNRFLRREKRANLRQRLEKRVLALDTNAAGPNNCSAAYVTPACIREIYDIPLATQAVEGNDFGLFELQQGWKQATLNSLFTNLAPFIPNGTHPIGNSIESGPLAVSIDNQGLEAMLDLNVAYPLLYPQGIRYLDTYTHKNPSLGYFDDFLDALDPSFCTSPGAKNKIDPQFPNKYWNHTLECGLYQPPNVISNSWILIKILLAGPVPSPAYIMRQCQEYLKLGLQGVSMVIASGDRGAFPTALKCTTRDSHPANRYFPQDCPYVLSVGATKLDKKTHDSEEAAYDTRGYYTSGGGFSTTFPRPAYQDAAVRHYLKTSGNLPASDTYNRSGRATPDVAALGQNIAEYTGPQHYDKHGNPIGGITNTTGDGTSASAPLVASLITRINGMRLQAGKKPLGFLNPIFYGHPEMFTDITTGHNNGCPLNDSSSTPTPAFYCAQGWDPVTGLGTPNFPKMVDYLTNLK